MQQLNFKPKAFLFDLNGTMINDMHYHSKAWHHIINTDLGKKLSFEEVDREMYGKNAELLERVFGKNHFTESQIENISMEKERRYQEAYAPYLALIDGLELFLEKSKDAGIKMAIGSAAIPFNIDFVLDGLNVRSYFDAIVSANDVVISKPNAETFLKGAKALGIDPTECVVFEDVPKGVESAHRAGMKSIVITSTHQEKDFKDFDNILGFIADYHNPILNLLY
jgi:beta-phosphoglucomutase